MAKILVVGYQGSRIARIRHLLTANGHRVISSKNGECGLRRFKREGGGIDLILTGWLTYAWCGCFVPLEALRENLDLPSFIVIETSNFHEFKNTYPEITTYPQYSGFVDLRSGDINLLKAVEYALSE
jgi:hypothetical protein